MSVSTGVLSSLSLETLCANLAAPAAQNRNSTTALNDSPAARSPSQGWTFLVDGALAAALEAAEAPADAHHRLFAIMAAAVALQRVKDALEVRRH